MNNNSSASKVAGIFKTAGQSFALLGDLTLQLHPSSDSLSGNKWTDEEIEMLRQAVTRFAEDLNKITTHIKDKQTSQIRATLKKKAFEEAGIKPIVQQSPAPVHIQNIQEQQQQQIQIVQQQPQLQQMQQMPANMEVVEEQEIETEQLNSAHMTLNRLNAHDNILIDVEGDAGLSSDVKLEFVANHEEVAS